VRTFPTFISTNWRATATKDSQTYPTGLTVSDAEFQALNIVRDAFHGEWSSTMKPQEAAPL